MNIEVYGDNKGQLDVASFIKKIKVNEDLYKTVVVFLPDYFKSEKFNLDKYWNMLSIPNSLVVLISDSSNSDEFFGSKAYDGMRFKTVSYGDLQMDNSLNSAIAFKYPIQQGSKSPVKPITNRVISSLVKNCNINSGIVSTSRILDPRSAIVGCSNNESYEFYTTAYPKYYCDKKNVSPDSIIFSAYSYTDNNHKRKFFFYFDEDIKEDELIELINNI